MPSPFLIVYLVGSTSDKLTFLKSCNGIQDKLSINKDGYGPDYFGTVLHKGIKFYVAHNLSIKQEAYAKYPSHSKDVWKTIDINDIEDRACLTNFHPIAIISASTVLYLNASCDSIKTFEALKNVEICTSYYYQSEDFADALNFLENIAPPASSDKLYDIKQNIFLSAQAFDNNSLPSLLPKEVTSIISNIYANLANRSILMFKPQHFATPPALSAVEKKIAWEAMIKEKRKLSLEEEPKVLLVKEEPSKEETSSCSMQ